MNATGIMVPDIGLTQKQHRDLMTPHKIALLVIIKEFCAVKIKSRQTKPFQIRKEDNWIHTNKQNRDFAVNLLKLIQNPDLPLKELNDIIKPILHQKTYDMFVERMRELRKGGIAGMMDYIQSLDSLLLEDAPNVPVVQRNSVIGMFLRRMLLAFDKLTFSHIAKLCQKFNHYYLVAFNCLISSEDDNDADSQETSDKNDSESEESEEEEEEEDDDEEDDIVLASQKQAELFIAQQASLLQINESKALSPRELQQKIRDLLKGNPLLTETYFLSYLNSLRVKEYCGAVENLFHHFDRNTSLPLDPSKLTPAMEEITRSCRYAALNLAILHTKFGHRNEALAALREAIMIAQEVNDNVCLQYTLIWLYKLCPPDMIETLIERSITKAGELNLWFMSSFGIQNLSKRKTCAASSPVSVLDFVMKGDTMNCQHCMTDIMGASYSLRAALHIHYGNNSMASLVSQLLLHLNTSDPLHGGAYHIGEGICIALCNLTNAFTLQGDYSSAAPIFKLLKHLFPPQTEHSSLWKLCEFFVSYDNALNMGSWVEAKRLITNVVIIDPLEAKYRTAQLLMHQGNLTKSYTIIKELLLDYKERKNSPYFHARLLILKSSILCHMTNYSAAIPSLLSCIELCLVHHMFYLKALALLNLASIQLTLGLPNIAIELLDSIFITFLAQGTHYDKGCCYMLYARCLSDIGREPSDSSTYMTAINMYDTAVDYFQKVKAIHKAKYCLTWQIYLCGNLNMIEKRNSYSHSFMLLDQQYPSSNWDTALFP